MADSDWKKRVGIEINFSPESSDDERAPKSECEREENLGRLSPRFQDSAECSLEGSEGMQLSEEDFLHQMMEEYGTTPPRARIRRKERRHREKEEQSLTKKSPKVFYTMRTKRRNTLDSIFLDGLLEKCEISDTKTKEEGFLADTFLTESSKRTKRSMKLLRCSERDMKHEQVGVRHSAPLASEPDEERTESLPTVPPLDPFKVVESCNRFMSLTSKPVGCQKRYSKIESKLKDCQENRLELFKKVAHLVRTGGGDKQTDKIPWRQLSQEEHLWQNELKDLIWLELQAWQADRTLTQQDEFLCRAREQVASLLDEIMNYQFQLQAPQLSAQSSDSGLGTEGGEGTEGAEDPLEPYKGCPRVGCLSIYCHSCVEKQVAALKDVDHLLSQLEAAEALYPSSKAFAFQYPLYRSPQFLGRVKAMCLWYNMTKHHRLKLLILGKHFTFSLSKNRNWPAFGEEDSGIDTSVGEEGSSTTRDSLSGKEKTYSKMRTRVVHFDAGSTTSSSPSDSNNSNVSHEGSEVAECLTEAFDCQTSVAASSLLAKSEASCMNPNPFRKYIEEILKTKGLRKSLYFLEKLHRHILEKAMISLLQPIPTSLGKENSTLDVNANDSVNTLEATDDSTTQGLDEQEQELRQFGYWSETAQDLRLPSYRSSFLFLAHIPIDVVYEMLAMRLEQKPANPSVLCIRQLMRELKEGLRMAALHRERYLHLVRSVLWDVDQATLQRYEDVSNFDKTCDAVLQLYLKYLKQWVPMVQHERFHKNLLEEEWQFVKSSCTNIPGALCIIGHTFCGIAKGMLEAIRTFLSSRMKEVISLKEEEDPDNESSTKHTVMIVCREFQTFLNELREKSMKTVSFTKSIVRDLEREEIFIIQKTSTCKTLSKALDELKSESLVLRSDIAAGMQSVQDVFSKWDLNHLDEVDQVALVTRLREILHLGYKYAFEYHKEICRVATKEIKDRLCEEYVSFAFQWMNFVKTWCERGKGMKPRWAVQGLEYLTFVCDPLHTAYLDEQEFEKFQRAVEHCILFVVGSASPLAEKRASSPHILHHSGRASFDSSSRPRSRASSPASRTKSPAYRASRSVLDASSSPSVPVTQRSLSANPSFSSDVDMADDTPDCFTICVKIPPRVSRIERVRSAIKNLENGINNKLLQQELIGSVTDMGSEDRIHIKSRSVTFSWQRGMKIGQGRFGKVYTAVNNETGELLAMKEIQLQPNDHRTIRRVAEELRTFEGITHKSLVRYYGVEIHREEMLIFMEFCAEGTLESFVASTESGLPENLSRKYTHQLLDAVMCLHRHGVVHRDIKSANIFLTDEGNSLKLGDFGSAVKIKAHTTLPGELQGFVGTQAYMAPEVFMKTNTDGHGRAADVWSVGCVVVEMSSGKRPWAEYDSNYQIMFKVGMGERPEAPKSLSEEGQQFLSLCLQHDPRQRASAQSLLLHSFVKVDCDEDYSSTLPSVLDDYLKLSK